MTEEEKAVQLEKIQRQREKNRMDELMAKQRIISYRMARERVRQQKLMMQQQQRQQQQSLQSSSQLGLESQNGSYIYDNTTTNNNNNTNTNHNRQNHRNRNNTLMKSSSSSLVLPSSLKRHDSMTLEPLHDDYSKLLQQQQHNSSCVEVTNIALRDVRK